MPINVLNESLLVFEWIFSFRSFSNFDNHCSFDASRTSLPSLFSECKWRTHNFSSGGSLCKILKLVCTQNASSPAFVLSRGNRLRLLQPLGVSILLKMCSCIDGLIDQFWTKSNSKQKFGRIFTKIRLRSSTVLHGCPYSQKSITKYDSGTLIFMHDIYMTRKRRTYFDAYPLRYFKSDFSAVLSLGMH